MRGTKISRPSLRYPKTVSNKLQVPDLWSGSEHRLGSQTVQLAPKSDQSVKQTANGEPENGESGGIRLRWSGGEYGRPVSVTNQRVGARSLHPHIHVPLTDIERPQWR